MTEPTVAEAAAAWRQAGVSVIQARADGTKAPAGSWKEWTQRLPTEAHVRGWFGDGYPGLGLVCGAVSGGLEMLELEGRSVAADMLDRLTEHAQAAGLGDVWVRLCAGYLERTPSGGIHLLYRLDGAPVPGNTKLAERLARPDELDKRELEILAQQPGKAFRRVLAETRGEGGFVVVAPSHGPVHPSGQPWTLLAGQPGQVPTVTAAERTELHRLVRLLDEMPAQGTVDLGPELVRKGSSAPQVHSGQAVPLTSAFAAPARPAPPPGYVSPGDDFEAREDWSSTLLLGGAGWTVVSTNGAYRTWRRPGKDRGISATTGTDLARDRLFVFSSSTEFETEQPYTKLGAYAVLHHHGDHTAAAADLQRLGFGVRPAPAVPSGLPMLPVVAQPAPDAPASPLERLRGALLTSADLDNIPEPDPLIKGVLYRDSVAWLIGSPGNGKSFVALDIAGCVATGESWQGNPAERGIVLYLIAEGAAGIKQRVRAWEGAMSGQVMVGVRFLPVAVQSANDAEWSAFVQLAGELQPALIVVDTQARVTVGMEENSAKDMGAFVHRVEQLRLASRACVLMVHHTGRSGEHMRGSTAMEGAATTILKVTKDEDALEIECTKQKDAPPFDMIKLRLTPYESSAILTPNDLARTVHSGQPAVTRMLDAWWESHGSEWVSPSVLIKSGTVKESTFYRVAYSLVNQHVINRREHRGNAQYQLPRSMNSQALPWTPILTGTTTPTLPPPFRVGVDGSGGQRELGS